MRGGASVRGQSPKPLTPTLSPPKRGEGELAGRGINLFKALRRIFRAIAAPFLLPPRARPGDHGEKVRMRGGASVRGQSPSPSPQPSPRQSGARGVLQPEFRAAERPAERGGAFAVIEPRVPGL